MNSQQSDFVKSLFDSDVSLSQLDWKDEYCVTEILQVVVDQANEIQDSATAAKVGWFLTFFTRNSNKRTQLASTSPVYELIVRCFTLATTGDSCRWIASAICHITASNPEGQRLFSTLEMVSAIINALDKYATTSESVQSLGHAIAMICFSVEGQRLFSSSAAVSAIINILNKYSTTPHDVGYLGRAINNICSNNPEGRRLFSTPETVSAIINALNNHATTSASVRSFGIVIGNITSNNPEGQRLFSTPEAVSAIVAVLNKHASTPDGVTSVGFAIANISVDNPEGQRRFSTPEAVSTIINALNKYATTPESAEFLARAISNIIHNNSEGKRLFSTLETVAAIINALNNYATSPESVGSLGIAIVVLTSNNAEGKRLFSTPETVAAIINALNKYATTPESVQRVGGAINNITVNNFEGQRCFSTPEAITAIIRRLKEYSHEPDSISNLISAVSIIAENVEGNAKEMFATEEFASIVRQILENASAPSTLCGALIATSYLRDSLVAQFNESSTMQSQIQNAANRLFGDANLRVDEDVAICASLLVSFGDEYAEAVCRREILQKLERFVATEEKDESLSKTQVRQGVKKISSRLVSRFQKWLNVLIRKHNFVGAEETLSEEIVEELFKQELDETNFLQKSFNFFELLDKVSSEVKKLVIQLFSAEIKSTEESSLLVIQPANVSSTFHMVLDRLNREFPQDKIFLPTDMSYSHANQYGSGTYGSVILASIISQQHRHVAAKMFKNHEQGIDEAKNYLRLDHPHITKFVGVTIIPQSSSVVLLLELADCDFGRILNSSSSPLSVNKIKKFSLQIASALEYLHKNKLRHLDLKPLNILVFRQGKEVTIKLADFGSILETEKTFTEKQFVAGTKSYLPPEYHAATAHRESIPVSATFDIFAFGVILMQMLIWDEEKRKSHFDETDKVKKSVKNGSIRFLDSRECCIVDDGWSQEVLNDENGRKLVEICKKCLMIDPTKRISDGIALVRALNDLAEDEDDIRKKQEHREILAAFQETLVRRARVEGEAKAVIQEATCSINEANPSLVFSYRNEPTGGY